MMKTTLAVLSTTALLFSRAAHGALPRPHLDDEARVKQHRAGANGDLVEGEEDLRKIILGWPHQGDDYEICHNCDIDESSGVRIDEGVGRVIPIPHGQECGAAPCMVMPGAPLGINTFHLRVIDEGEVSTWSEARNFNIVDPGFASHEEL